jgi:hypothetical protein
VADDQYNQAATAAPAPASGAAAVDKAVEQSALGGAEVPVAPAGEAANVVQTVGSRTFLLSDGVWIDTAFDTAKMKATPVQFASADYFNLLAARPELAAPLALGPRVIAFANDGAAYEVTTKAAPPLSAPPTYTPAVPAATVPATRAAAPTVGVTPPDGPLPTQYFPTPTRGGGGPCASALIVPALVAIPVALRRRRM